MATRPAAALLAIGDELVLGEKLDTNSQWLADQLGLAGLRVIDHQTVPDDRDVIASTMVGMREHAQVLIVGGGLGPTKDDLTREGLSDALARLTEEAQPLIEDASALRDIEAIFEMMGRAMIESNRNQAMRPRGASAIANEHGTAPGLLAQFEREGTPHVIACLPGPPREMRPMFEGALAPILQALPGVEAAELRVSQVFGLGESELATRISELMHRDNNPAVGTTASSGMVTCRVRFEPTKPVQGPYESDAPATAAEEALSAIEAVASGYVVSQRYESLAATLLREAQVEGLSIATAESCTGGLIGQLITAEAGSSATYAGGWVTYSNRMKTQELGVPESQIQAHGAVSPEVAIAMASGARERSGADIALSVTGVAGPGGGTSEKPVGTVWIGVASPGGPASARGFRFMGDRASVRLWSANTALFIGLLAVRARLDLRLLREVSAVSR